MTTPFCYSNLLHLSFTSNVEESKGRYETLTERHLQAMWLEQKYFRTLETESREKVEVISPGIWNSEAGPDFLKAHLKIGSKELRGDIELHFSQEGWYHHHHHTDPRYDDVILHLVYWEPVTFKPIITSKQSRVETATLQPKLTISESRLLNLIDLDLYPYKIFAGSGRCARTLFNRLSTEKSLRLFRSAACWRLEEKWRRLEIQVNNADEALCLGICRALGYKNNSEPFCSLFHTLNETIKKVPSPIDERELLVIALSITGFFNPHFQKKWSASPYYQSLYEQNQLEECPSISLQLRLDHIRPANHPVRRLVYMVKLLLDPMRYTLSERLLQTWKNNWQEGDKKRWREMKRALIEQLPLYSDIYWETHYLFEEKPIQHRLSLIGGELYRELLINVIIPYLYSNIRINGNEQEIEAFSSFFASLDAAKTKKQVYLAHRFFGETPKKELLVQADILQGAYQLHRDFCIHYEASCQGCPFVELYQQSKI